MTCASEPTKVSVCHCLDCQKRTGSSFGVAAFFDRDTVRIEGPTKSFSRQSDSGFPVTFHFCPDCGSTVFWKPQRKPGAVAVAVGSFADPDFPAPTQTVYSERRHSWLDMCD
ncbi:aldehyde-activating protein [Mesorhizobium sp. L-8-10]|nr:aldehyde-activating protein [Mesorhizobium sp. L-8-10]